ncbi:hypothetical protein [Paenibacillus sp. 1-18]|uniref:hypothetical protein n=1 Tax=Paenibacillus sp. 1-18 TaxID=1333846 RepID=UPI001E3E4857|nr:hypothetical protein [Paenibacillus sp. 1-18]
MKAKEQRRQDWHTRIIAYRAWPRDESFVLRKSLFCRTIEILAVQNKACIILS